MVFICFIQKLSANRLRLVVEAKQTGDTKMDQLRTTGPFRAVKGGQTFISVMGYTWRYDHDVKEIVMTSGHDMFILKT